MKFVIIAVPTATGKRFHFGVVSKGKVNRSVKTWLTARQAVAAGRREFA